MAFCQSLDAHLRSLHVGLKPNKLLCPTDSTAASTGRALESYEVTPIGNAARQELDERLAASYENQATELAVQLESETLRRLETPRTREACSRLGIRPEDLQAKNLRDFKYVGDSVDRVRLRFNHYETKRQGLLKQVLEERGRIISDRYETRGSTVRQPSLHVMEELLDKEAKRLEKELRAQVRCHSAVEKENDNIIQKENALNERVKYRSERQLAKKRLCEERGDVIRQDYEHRSAKVAQKKSQLEIEEETKQATYLAVLLEDEVRLMEFGRNKDDIIRLRAEKRDEHRIQIEKLREMEEHERSIRGAELVQKMEEKIDNLKRRNEEMARERELKAEEQNLKLVDTMERKEMLERQFLHKRELVQKQLEEDDGRLCQLDDFKDAIVEKRKLRQKQSQSASSRGLPLSSPGPGPAAYNIREARENAENYNRGGVFISSGNTKVPILNSMEDIIERSKHNPAPGCYDPRVLPKGDKTDFGAGRVTAFSNSESKSYIVEEEQRAAKIPGPGAYTVEMKERNVGTKIVRAYVPGSRDTSWVSSADTPGPAAYAVDPFLRNQRLRKNQRSMPSLYPSLKNG